MIDEKKPAEYSRPDICPQCGTNSDGQTNCCQKAESLWNQKVELKATIRWMAQTVHQAYHEKDTFMECPKNTCDAAKQALAMPKDKPLHGPQSDCHCAACGNW